MVNILFQQPTHKTHNAKASTGVTVKNYFLKQLLPQSNAPLPQTCSSTCSTRTSVQFISRCLSAARLRNTQKGPYNRSQRNIGVLQSPHSQTNSVLIKKAIVTLWDISTQILSTSFQSSFQWFLFSAQTNMVLCSVTLQWVLIPYSSGHVSLVEADEFVKFDEKLPVHSMWLAGWRISLFELFQKWIL